MRKSVEETDCNMNVKYVLFTRFNLVQSYSKEKEYDIECDEEYLDYRFSIFEKYTLPSVMSSELKDFVWFILFSSRTPEKFRSKISKYVELYNSIRPIYIESKVSIDIIELKRILENAVLEEGADYYLISRLDNDDAISSKYFSTLHDYAMSIKKYESPIAIRPINGYQYNTKKRVLCKYSNPVNQFLTVYCSKDQIIIPILIRHTKVGREIADVRNLDLKPLWMEVINNENVYNKSVYKPQNVVCNLKELSDFYIKDGLELNNSFLVFLFSVVNYLIIICHAVINKVKYICGRVR